MIEAIVEELEPKRELFAELDRIRAPDAMLATNTSALSVTEIAEATEHPERVIGMHFFNPAPLLPLVEIVRTQQSSDEARRAAYEWAEQAGKQPVRCNDTPGFIVNRILIPLLNDCVRVLDEAGVTPEDLDTAMTNGAGWPMGPCALVDLIGIDVHVHASEALHAKLGEPRMAPPERLVADAGDGQARPQERRGLLHVRVASGVAGYGRAAWQASPRPDRSATRMTRRARTERTERILVARLEELARVLDARGAGRVGRPLAGLAHRSPRSTRSRSTS